MTGVIDQGHDDGHNDLGCPHPWRQYNHMPQLPSGAQHYQSNAAQHYAGNAAQQYQLNTLRAMQLSSRACSPAILGHCSPIASILG